MTGKLTDANRMICASFVKSPIWLVGPPPDKGRHLTPTPRYPDRFQCSPTASGKVLSVEQSAYIAIMALSIPR